VDTAAVLGNAMTDYLLAVGAKTAPAARAPEHMAEWLDAHGYRIVRVPADIEPGDPDDTDFTDRIAPRIDRRSWCRDGADRCSILCQVLAARATRADVRRVA
jgi:hypothetical protein